MDNDAKLRPIYLLEILQTRTDEDHFLTTSELCEILKKEYKIDTHRTTLKSDIELLQHAGIGVQCIRSTQNLYNFIDHKFDIPELKLLIDAVESSKFIPKSKSDELVEKLTALAGSFKGEELKRNLMVNGRTKAENKQILYIVDAINNAINRHKKIKFQKVEYNIKKELVPHHGGEKYVFSPYSLVWDGDFYYLVGYSDKYEKITTHRVDRIAEVPDVLDDNAVPMPVNFDINKYVNTMFHMYDAPRKEVELVCDNGIMNAVIDKFGADVPTYACDQHNFRVITEVAVGTVFFNWVFGFGGLVNIKAPEEVKKQYKEMVLKAAEMV